MHSRNRSTELFTAWLAAITGLVGLVGLTGLASLSACQEPGYTTCGELVCPEGYQCRGGGCVSDEQVAACEGQVEETECTAELDGWCRDGYCQIDLCGNGALDTYPRRGDEACDGELGLLACADVGADFGLAGCTETCGRDTSACESFSWRRAIVGTGAGRAVVVEGDATFAVRGNTLAWQRVSDSSPWKASARLGSPIGDVVALSGEQALVIASRSNNALGLWHYQGVSNELVDTSLSLPLGGGARYSGGVALAADRALLAAGASLWQVRRAAGPGAAWMASEVSLGAGCPVPGPIALHWAAAITVGSATIYAAVENQIVRLALAGDAATCSLVRELGQPPIGLGGRGGALSWAVDRLGTVYDATTWAVRNLDDDGRALDAAVAQNVDGVTRLWASEGDGILVFEGGSWWRSRSGSTALPDDLGGRFATHRPLAVDGARVVAVQSSQEVGLVERNAREWLLGWETDDRRAVVDVLADDDGRAWSLLEDGRLSLGSREGAIAPALATPVSPLALVDGAPFIGSNTGVYRLAAGPGGAGFVATREGSALPTVRGVWAAPALAGEGTLYALAQSGLHAKPLGSGDWQRILPAGAGTACPNPIRLAGAVVGGAPRLFLLCRAQGTSPRGYQLLSVDPLAAPIAPIAVELPDHVYVQLAAGGDGAAWVVAGARAVRVAAPYVAAAPLPIERLSPATGKLGELTEQLTDVVVAGDGTVYLAAGRQNLFAWDGARFVRISSSQGNTAANVALAARGGQLYMAHQTGVDLLLRHPAP